MAFALTHIMAFAMTHTMAFALTHIMAFAFTHIILHPLQFHSHNHSIHGCYTFENLILNFINIIEQTQSYIHRTLCLIFGIW
jgi:hypothetical protein